MLKPFPSHPAPRPRPFRPQFIPDNVPLTPPHGSSPHAHTRSPLPPTYLRPFFPLPSQIPAPSRFTKEQVLGISVFLFMGLKTFQGPLSMPLVPWTLSSGCLLSPSVLPQSTDLSRSAVSIEPCALDLDTWLPSLVPGNRDSTGFHRTLPSSPKAIWPKTTNAAPTPSLALGL